ncbi:MAG TPA: hypothetical protein DCW52_06320 [Gammaproteobacteria bacterium]|mgnify:CR=1 FL=1|jgi:hypothetical protein|nr:hypothetical protein [Gammaproteobacteria bacterium]
MNNKISMNKNTNHNDSDTSQAMDFAELDLLFASARGSDESLRDDNFTKMVVNELPANPERIDKTSLSFDLIGTVIGGLLAFFLIDFKSLFAILWNQGVSSSTEVTGQLLNSVSAVSSVASAPGGFSVSIGTIMIAGLVTTVASLAAWLMVEKSNSSMI